MKKAILFVLFAFLQVPVFGQAKIVFESTNVDLGDLEASEKPIKIELKFKNEGNEPLTINKVWTSFSDYSTVKFPETAIAPGEQGVITVFALLYYYLPGKYKKTITVKSSGLIEMSRIFIKYNVIAKPD